MPTLGGAVCLRDGDRLDFPWRQCVQSLLPVCDEVVICLGSGSTDGSDLAVRLWSDIEPKIKVCVWDWPNPKGDLDFFVRWINYAREHLRTDWHFQLDADEILHENSYAQVRRFIFQGRRSAICTRRNFWRDAGHTIPEGHCLGKRVIRLAPANVWLPSDGVHPNGAEAVMMGVSTSIEIGHYGFLRSPSSFFEKERLLQGYFFNHYDPRLEAAERDGGNWMEHGQMPEWARQLDDYVGTHPKIIQGWLAERGY